MNETIEILTDERHCRDCLEFDQLRFLDNIKSQKNGTGWCKK